MEETRITDDRDQALFDRALSIRQMIKDGRAGPVDRFDLAICYYHLSNFEKAVAELEAIRSEHPDYVDIARVERLEIFCRIQLKQYDDAVPLIERRLKIDETDTMVLGMQAFIYEEKGNYSEAISIHRRIVSLDPDHNNSLNSLGYLLAVHGTKAELDEAYRCLVKAVQQKPDHPAYLDSLGVLLQRKGKKDQARKALMKALKYWPQNSVIMDHLKDLLHLSDRKQG